ncbi:MAG: hypothetical protein WBE13_16800 [Candidatus Acidiferrum sp.]
MSGDDDYDYDDEPDLEHLREQFMPELYEDFARDVLSGKDDLYGEIIDQFTSERLQSFYLSHPNVAEGALAALAEARALKALHPSAALVFAAIAIEVGLKTTLLKPILHGMVSIDSAAALVAALVPDQQNDSFKKVLFGILKEVGGVDLPAFKRPGCDQTLWEEIANVRTKRNDVIHKAGPVSTVDAERSIEIASTVLEVLFPQVIAALELKTDANLRIVAK